MHQRENYHGFLKRVVFRLFFITTKWTSVFFAKICNLIPPYNYSQKRTTFKMFKIYIYQDDTSISRVFHYGEDHKSQAQVEEFHIYIYIYILKGFVRSFLDWEGQSWVEIFYWAVRTWGGAFETILIFFKLKTTFCSYWTSTKIKTSMACVKRVWSENKKGSRAMTTSKNEVFIEL